MKKLIKKNVLILIKVATQIPGSHFFVELLFRFLPDSRTLDIYWKPESLRDIIFVKYISILRVAYRNCKKKKNIFKDISYFTKGEKLFTLEVNICEYTQSRYYIMFPDPPLRDLILKGGEVYFDVGANVGIFSLLAANFFKKVLCFEPLPPVYNNLKRNLSGFDNVEVINCGVSSARGSLTIHRHVVGDGGSTFENLKDELVGESFSVNTCMLDDYKDSFDGVSLIKIDVEGHELDVIKGSREFMERYKPQIYLETHDPEFLKEIVEELPRGANLYDPWRSKEGMGFPDTLIYW